MTAILYSILAHMQKMRDTILSRKMYAVCKCFKWVYTNQYRYHEEYVLVCSNKDPADIWAYRATLDIQTFSSYDLSPPFFLPINARTVSTLRSVALLTDSA